MKIEGEGLPYDKIFINRENLSLMLAKLELPLPSSVLDKQGYLKPKSFARFTEDDLEGLKQIFLQELVSHNVIGMGWIKQLVYKRLGILDTIKAESAPEQLSVEQRQQLIYAQFEAFYQAPKQEIDQLRRLQYIESLTRFVYKIINLINVYLLIEVSEPLSLSDIIYPVNEHGITLRGLSIIDEIIYKMSGKRFDLFDQVFSLSNYFSNPNEEGELDKAFKDLERQLRESNLAPSKRLGMQQLRELREKSNSYFQ